MTGNYSLRRRLLVSATLLLLLFLGGMGIALNRAFETSVLSNAEDALKNQVLLLMANIDVADNSVMVPSVLSEPRLSQAESDLFAQISTPRDGVVWESDSLLGTSLPNLASQPGVFAFIAEPEWPAHDPVYAMTFAAVWETEAGDLPMTITVAENRLAYAQRLRQYRSQVLQWLGVLGVTLLVLLLGLLSWVLRPLGKVATQVGEIESGQRQQFDEDYPLEVSKLTQNLNQLLHFEQQRIERQQNVLGNLAHSLKTPLAILRGLDYPQSTRPEAERQLGAMQNIIDYQLQSASAVGRRRFAKPIEIGEPTAQLLVSLGKLYQDKELSTTVEIADDVRFFGDPGDWLELVGNLLDNAFKWAESQVTISVRNEPLGSHRQATRIEVVDDGAGIDAALKETILQRGVRLDSQTPGHGLGLHIVKGIVEAYEGELEIADNRPCGTRFVALLN